MSRGRVITVGDRALAIIAALVLGGLLISACGASDDSTSTAGGLTTSTQRKEQPNRSGSRPAAQHPEGRAQAQENGASSAPPTHRDSGGGSAQFEVEGGDNSIARYGAEIRGPDFIEAAAALHGYLDARAAGAWRAACRYLAAAVTGQLASLGGGAQGGGKTHCSSLLARLSKAVPRRTMRKAAVADLTSLRAADDRGFLLYRGAGGSAFFLPVVREGGAWKLAAVAPSPLP